MKPTLQVIEGDGCGHCFSISDAAAATWEVMDPVDQAEVSAGIARAYSKFLRLLFDMAMSSYRPKEDSIALTAFSAPETLFHLGKHALRCEIFIESTIFRTHVRAIEPIDVLHGHQIHGMNHQR